MIPNSSYVLIFLLHQHYVFVCLCMNSVIWKEYFCWCEIIIYCFTDTVTYCLSMASKFLLLPLLRTHATLRFFHRYRSLEEVRLYWYLLNCYICFLHGEWLRIMLQVLVLKNNVIMYKTSVNKCLFVYIL